MDGNDNVPYKPLPVLWSSRLPILFPLVGQTPVEDEGDESESSRVGEDEEESGDSAEREVANMGVVDDEQEGSGRPRKRHKRDSKKEEIFPLLRAYHIRIRPDKNACSALRHMLAGVHKTHNLVVEKLRDCVSFANAYEIRNMLVPSEHLPSNLKWLSGIPSQARANKVRQLVGAYNTDVKNKGRKGFKMKFSSWRMVTELTMEFDKWSSGNSGVVNSFEKVDGFTALSRKHGVIQLSARSTRFKDGTKIPCESLKVPFCDKPWLVNHLLESGLEHAYRIKWHRRLNRWWLITLVDLNKARPPSRSVVSKQKTEDGQRCCDTMGKGEGSSGGGSGSETVDAMRTNAARNVVALDPGVRTFQTTYDSSGRVHKLCGGLGERVKQLCRKLDVRRSCLDRKVNTHKEAGCVQDMTPPCVKRKERQSRRNQIKCARYKMHATIQKVRNTVKWNHWESVNFLFRHYDTVLIPVFQTQSMLPTLMSKVARAMATLSHFSFRLRLLSRKQEDCRREVFVTREPGTSRTCCLCGHWNSNLGGATLFSCAGCGAQIDRDVNGAVGNFQAYLTDGP